MAKRGAAKPERPASGAAADRPAAGGPGAAGTTERAERAGYARAANASDPAAFAGAARLAGSTGLASGAEVDRATAAWAAGTGPEATAAWIAGTGPGATAGWGAASVSGAVGPKRLAWWRRFRPPRRLSFTREGRLIVILSVGVGFAAINTGNNLLYLLLGWLLSFIIASGILSEMTLKRLVVDRRPPPRVFAGEPFLMEVVIRNQKPRRASFSIEVEDLVGSTPLDKRCYFLKIPAAKAQRTSYRHTFVRRGLYTLTGYRVATKFPFALFRKSRDVEAPIDVLVYPARVPMPRPAPRTPTRGETTANRAGRRGEFFGLREHRAGDDRRDVHWRSSARTGRMLVREYEDEHARRVVIGVDNALPDAVREAVTDGALTPAAEAQVAALERAISVAASLAAVYLEVGWTVELCARDCHVAAGTGRIHAAKLARTLALLPYVSDQVAFAALPPRVDSVLVIPRAVAAAGRPSAATVMDV